MMSLVSKFIPFVIFSCISFQLNRFTYILFYSADYKSSIMLENHIYTKHILLGDMWAIDGGGTYIMNDSTITFIRVKSSVNFNGYYTYQDSIVVPNKDTITVDGLTYYKAGGVIKPPKVKRKKKG